MEEFEPVRRRRTQEEIDAPLSEEEKGQRINEELARRRQEKSSIETSLKEERKSLYEAIDSLDENLSPEISNLKAVYFKVKELEDRLSNVLPG